MVKGNVTSAVGSAAETLVFSLFVELAIIIIACRIFAFVAHRYLGQTKVVGEIMAGIMLGPSVLGLIVPDAPAMLFSKPAAPVLVGLSQFGLLLLMFQIGMEFDFTKHSKGKGAGIALISLLGIVLPFVGGVGFAIWFSSATAMPTLQFAPFAVFMGVAMSITAIPILGRIFIELGLADTRIATVTISAAAIDDVVGWVLLGVATALATSGINPSRLAFTLAALVLYALVIVKIAGPVFSRVLDRWASSTLSYEHTAIVVAALLLSALVTSALGVFAIFGAFILGFSLHKNKAFKASWGTKTASLTYAVFLPVFFAYTGTKTDIGSISGSFNIVSLIAILIIAFFGKFVGGYLGARMGGESHVDAITIGFCMNTRALMELIVLNVGYDLGVLPRSVFTMLVIMALVSTVIASPVIRMLMIKRKMRDASGEAALPRPV